MNFDAIRYKDLYQQSIHFIQAVLCAEQQAKKDEAQRMAAKFS